jgi:hypothetical protein
MGLPKKRNLTADQLARLYITVIRQNWHILPQEQIIELLGWDRARYEFTLKEDDFLDHKLGFHQPRLTKLVYASPSAQEKSRAAEMRTAVRHLFGSTIDMAGEDLFAFVGQLSDPRYPPARGQAKPAAGEVDLTSGWVLDAGPGLEAIADRFRRYLRQAMKAEVRAGRGQRRIRLAVNGSGAEAFRIEVAAEEIAISASSQAGLLQALYHLQDRMEGRQAPFLAPGTTERKTVWNPRYVYSYFALYGDPLMEPERDPFPDAYLEKLARSGVNGVWMQAVLNTLAPAKDFPEFGRGWETRLKNLNALVQRAAGFGVRVYLYLNEPRAMPPEFFQKYPDVQGSSYRNLHAMCTSVPRVREWIADSLAHVVKMVPDLGGIFSITMSENHTNCFSHGGAWGEGAPNAGDCPRCSRRTSWETIAELIGTFRNGIRRHSPTADVISYDWGWGEALSEKLIPLLPKDTSVLSISEWYAPVNRGGVQTKVGEYSISVVGPGPRATRNWQRARASGVASMAKVQFNNTWEISAVPYIPAMHLIVEHCERLEKAGISGVMNSWTCGGYASPNFACAKQYYAEPRAAQSEILRTAAAQRYGTAASEAVVDAWRRFSDAFQEFPYGVHVYIIPTQHGPANPLRLHPTKYKAGMILFPYDDYRAWSGVYPPEVVQKQFAKLAEMWKRGIDSFEAAMSKVPEWKRADADLDLAIAKTCHHHFQSVANQVEFYLLRDSPRQTRQMRERMRRIAEDEMDLARRQFPLARRHSVIAYEASNHYYYTPLDLVEKALHCRYVIEELKKQDQG